MAVTEGGASSGRLLSCGTAPSRTSASATAPTPTRPNGILFGAPIAGGSIQPAFVRLLGGPGADERHAARRARAIRVAGQLLASQLADGGRRRGTPVRCRVGSLGSAAGAAAAPWGAEGGVRIVLRAERAICVRSVLQFLPEPQRSGRPPATGASPLATSASPALPPSVQRQVTPAFTANVSYSSHCAASRLKSFRLRRRSLSEAACGSSTVMLKPAGHRRLSPRC